MFDTENFCVFFLLVKGWRYEECVWLGEDLTEKVGCCKGLDF